MKPLRKLLIATHTRPFPDYIQQWRMSIFNLFQIGYEFALIDDSELKGIARLQGFNMPSVISGRKLCDFRPAYGAMLSNDLRGFDYWGHCDLDMVFGRLDHFMSDEELREIDIWSDDPGAICGPFTLYRNEPHINNLFRFDKIWREVFENPTHMGYDEKGFTVTCVQAERVGFIKWASGYRHSNDKSHLMAPDVKLLTDGTLMVDGVEKLFHHFNRTKKWPL